MNHSSRRRFVRQSLIGLAAQLVLRAWLAAERHFALYFFPTAD